MNDMGGKVQEVQPAKQANQAAGNSAHARQN
jgi:hypothetical protein